MARFQAALGALESRPGASLAGVAHAAGYADQAHLSREFHALSGVAPSLYLRRRAGAAPGFVPLD